MVSASDASRLQQALSSKAEPPLTAAARIAAAYKLTEIPGRK
jgi:hypothetical protein